MKNKIKKITAVILMCFMLVSVIPFGVFAKEVVVSGRGETYNHYPQIMVKGFGASSVKIYYEDDPEQKSLFYPSYSS